MLGLHHHHWAASGYSLLGFCCPPWWLLITWVVGLSALLTCRTAKKRERKKFSALGMCVDVLCVVEILSVKAYRQRMIVAGRVDLFNKFNPVTLGVFVFAENGVIVVFVVV